MGIFSEILYTKQQISQGKKKKSRIINNGNLVALVAALLLTINPTLLNGEMLTQTTVHEKTNPDLQIKEVKTKLNLVEKWKLFRINSLKKSGTFQS